MKAVMTAFKNIRTAVQLGGLILLLCGIASQAFAQSTAVLNGTVMDETGATIPNARVVATNQTTGVTSASQTDQAGAYLFPALPIGVYRIEVSAAGFGTAVVENLTLTVATNITKDIQLHVGQISEKVTITADTPLVETATTGVGQVINDKTVQEIPLNGRHFTDLSLLTPGTVTPPANGFLSAPLRGQGSFGINTAGQREDTTNWLVNGINFNDNVQNQITFQPPIDTLAEYKIDNSTFPAQYGRNSGSIVNLATRSGTNDYHGEAFEFFRNNALDARNFFNTRTDAKTGNPLVQAPFKRNEFGADFGGPIKKNKIFFFLAYEGLRQHQAITVTTTVPSAKQIAAVTSPAVKKLLTLIPPANLVGTGNAADPTTFNGFTGGTLANVSLNQGSADIDIEVSGKDRIHGYYVMQRDLRQEPTAGGTGGVQANLPGYGDTRDGKRHLMTISEDHTFSPVLFNTVRLGFNRIHLTFTPNAVLDPAAFGINLPAGAPTKVGIPFMNVASGAGASFGAPTQEPQGRGDTTGILNDTVSWLKGRHSFAFGGEIRRAYNNNIANNIGQFTYTSIQNFLNDQSSQATTQLGNGNDKLVQPSYDVFAQDSFKVKPNFTLNIGLRYAWNSTPSDSRGRFTNFDLATGTLAPASQPYHTNNKNFQPRVGFAWDPFKNGKTSIRASYAILTQAPTTNIITGLSSNPPFALPLSASSGTNSITLENPGAGITGVSLGPFAINNKFNNMYAQDWNLTVERQMTSTLGLTVAYVGLKATHLQLQQNVNQPFVTNGIYGSTRPFPTLPLTSTVLPTLCAPPNPACTFGNINQINSAGNSNYNALWVTVDKHYSRGLQFLATYTYSKSLDYNSLSSNETYILQNAYNPRGDYGPSEFDVRHRLALSGFYELPFKGNRLIQGWQFGIINQLQSGNPINPTVTIGPGAGVSLTVRPDITGSVHTTGDPAQWFVDRSVFVTPCVTTGGLQRCHPGGLARNAITGPSFLNTDFSVIKNTKIAERLALQFRAEMFDVLNHPNFGNPNLLKPTTPTVGVTTTSTFGVIQSTRFPTGDFGSSRQMQLALKLQF